VHALASLPRQSLLAMNWSWSWVLIPHSGIVSGRLKAKRCRYTKTTVLADWSSWNMKCDALDLVKMFSRVDSLICGDVRDQWRLVWISSFWCASLLSFALFLKTTRNRATSRTMESRLPPKYDWWSKLDVMLIWFLNLKETETYWKFRKDDNVAKYHLW